MAKIHELSEILANQIAAGEVVERPASVVKELVENSIDAGAKQIDIIIEDAGLKSIQIIDDGNGIEAEDVETAFKRHATSKIIDRKDLFKVHTLGFRGEALPSIASVSDVVMETAVSGQAGTKIHIKGGEVLEKTLSASREGTTITVSDLFYNTPARLKYLKSVQTELSYISDIVNRLALSHTDVALSLTNNGRQLLQSAGNGNLQQTIGAIYGVQNARQMVKFEDANLDFKVSGYTSLPKLTRASRNYISLLVNGRYVKNFQLTKAVIEGYGSKLMTGRYPITVLSIELDPTLVDVNVHPTKQEIKISKEDELVTFIQKTIFERIGQENLIPDGLQNIKSKTKEKLDFEQLKVGLNEASKQYQTKQHRTGITPEVTAALVGEKLTKDESQTQINEKINEETKVEFSPIIIKDKQDLKSDRVKEWDEKYQSRNKETEITSIAEESGSVDDERKDIPRFPTLRYIGQMHGTFLFAEGEEGLYIVDQHAAQERVKYEYYREEIGKVSPTQQNLLVPIVLTYPTTDALIIDKNMDKLKELGIYLEDFGQNTYIIRQHPTWFKEGQEESIIREMIDYFLKDRKLSIAKFREKTAIMMSCKRSIKANHHLDDKQAKSILEQLKTCENPFNCPHGRPVLVKLSNKDLEHMFKRIQDPHHTGILEED